MRRIGKYCALSVVLLFAQCSQASFSTIFQTATVDNKAKTVTFDVGFNQTPDFKTTNAQGDDASAFQVFIDPKPSPAGFDYFDTVSIVRGVHIGSSDHLPIIDVNQGAFGDDRGVTNFSLDTSDTVHFSVPFDVLGTGDGKFDYRVESYEFGTLTSMIDSTTVAVPLPSGAYMAIPTVMMIVIGTLVRRRFA
jgi:hypothetical protein